MVASTNITVNLEICNSKIENFESFVSMVYQSVLKLGRDIVSQTLEKMDDTLKGERDRKRFRCKGFRKTCVKTIMGPVEYQRRVYLDKAAVEKKQCVYLLDEALDINRIGLFSKAVCNQAANLICETTYRGAARAISEMTGMSVSHQAVHNMIQRLGEERSVAIEKHTALAQNGQGLGEIETPILYEENDGIWLKLQGKSRKEHGPSKEMKVGIAYDGVRHMPCGKNKKRRILDNKVAYASFESATDFKKQKEGLVASRFNVNEILLRILNGDGANWMSKTNSDRIISVLDEFHRNKKITECVRDPSFAKLLKDILYKNDIDTLLMCIEAQINSVSDESEIAKLQELLRYYTDNKENLLGYYNRGIEIPLTRKPGEIHHARLGAMESNVYTLIGNRMKDGRACWSIRGANNLALILCAYHTSGLESLFCDSNSIPAPKKEPEFVDTLPLFGADKVPVREGKGYEFPGGSALSSSGNVFIREFAKSLRRGLTNNF